MSTHNPVIITVGFSRAHSLKRLLTSINNAHYPHDVKLIISLDGGAYKEVTDYANEFSFKHGECEVVTRQKNIGLRSHILWCGDQTEKYGSVIILEDDLIVDPYFYYYTIETLEFYETDEHVAGIALYSPNYNDIAQLPFHPLDNGYDVYPMKIVCSWGQAWTKKHWKKFIHWYQINSNQDSIQNIKDLPQPIKNWPESSWKKYYSAFIAKNNLYFIYPYRSYTSNCSDEGGTHITNGTNVFQVNLSSPNRHYKRNILVKIDQQEILYDSYMEQSSQWFEKMLNIKHRKLIIDLYGQKNHKTYNNNSLFITTKRSKAPISQYSLKFKPVELNLLHTDSKGKITITKAEDIICSHQTYNLEYWSNFNIISSKALLFISRKLILKIIKRIKNTLATKKKYE